MASARARVLAAVLLACLLVGPTNGWFRRRRRRWVPPPPPPCPSPHQALYGVQTTWDQYFTFQCPSGQVISRIKSVHCNTAEDRVWRFECRASGISSFYRHYWTGWVNDYDGNMAFTCPFNSVITGFKSQYSNSHEDRRWKVRCSKKTGQGMVTHSCLNTGYVNNFDHAMNYLVPTSYYLTGMHGYQQNNYGDRRYRFTLCKVTP